MEQRDYSDLQNNISLELFTKLSRAQNELHGAEKPKAKEIIQKAVEEEFLKMTEEQKIMSLSEDEVKVLLAFRAWSSSAGSASGVFHWRKQYGK
jgi:hypothetical protein